MYVLFIQFVFSKYLNFPPLPMLIHWNCTKILSGPHSWLHWFYWKWRSNACVLFVASTFQRAVVSEGVALLCWIAITDIIALSQLARTSFLFSCQSLPFAINHLWTLLNPWTPNCNHGEGQWVNPCDGHSSCLLLIQSLPFSVCVCLYVWVHVCTHVCPSVSSWLVVYFNFFLLFLHSLLHFVILHVFGCFACMYILIPCVCSVLSEQKGTLDLLGPGIVNDMGAWNQTWLF